MSVLSLDIVNDDDVADYIYPVYDDNNDDVRYFMDDY